MTVMVEEGHDMYNIYIYYMEVCIYILYMEVCKIYIYIYECDLIFDLTAERIEKDQASFYIYTYRCIYL